MGYELDRLMQQYGVSAPVLAPAPVAPVRPVSPTESPGQQAAYEANRAAYDQYATEYQRRLRETPMYAQPQFAGPSTSRTWFTFDRASSKRMNRSIGVCAQPLALTIGGSGFFNGRNDQNCRSDSVTCMATGLPPDFVARGLSYGAPRSIHSAIF